MMDISVKIMYRKLYFTRWKMRFGYLYTFIEGPKSFTFTGNNFIHNIDSLNSLSDSGLINLSLKDLKSFPQG